MARSLTGACQCRADKALRYSMPIRIDDLRSCFPAGYQSRRLSDRCWLEFQREPWRFPRDRASRTGVRSRNVFGAPRIPEWGRSVHARLESKEDTRVRRYRVEHEFPHEQTRFVALLAIHLPQAVMAGADVLCACAQVAMAVIATTSANRRGLGGSLVIMNVLNQVIPNCSHSDREVTQDQCDYPIWGVGEDLVTLAG